MKRLATALAVIVLSSAFIAPAHAASLQLNPKLGGCYLFTEKELNSASPLTNPIACSKVHNAETFGIDKWPLKNQPWKYTEDMARDAAEQVCMQYWDYPDDSDLNYWAYFTPSPAQWAKGARWIRCDAMARLSEKGTFKQMYATWTGNAGLTSGYLA
ncbi:hypothetical protein MCEMRE182_00518 [Candidatus Nanopelagicaceae bacterium]